MNVGRRIFNAIRLSNRTYSKLPPELVVFMDDSMVVSWHPEQPFPYECSKPLPPMIPKPTSVLKIGEAEIKSVFHKTNPKMTPHELAKLTYTTKHRWYPRARSKKAKTTLPDRPYL
ncbi:unnamed protein product [Trichogramma brassicae]|uniref:Large ribosomal subunit protein mL42 n=2 Tax=Trichogramma TaxID=7490 RepID=A0A6H5I8D8_9HYME|nr:39S ribosomal protein L42, mitochondrial [Trichogramma pretiosum]XP_014230848.1 39S ribosomal protein L42, mitochondrial [Trichogramma pretiosum]CAB0034237.1 unnamed protein product [Trichogramma brassicae]